MKDPSNIFVVSCVLIIDWRRRCRRVCSPFSCISSCSVWYGGKNYVCHVRRMFVWIPLSNRWHYGYDTVLIHGGIQGDIVYMCDEFGVHGKLYVEIIRPWCFIEKHENGPHNAGQKTSSKRHVNRMMFVWLPVSSRWHYGYDTVLMYRYIQGGSLYIPE